MPATIAISSSVAQNPYNGGLAWLALQLLLGFRRLGYQVLFLDRLEPEMCVDENGRSTSFEKCINVKWLAEVMGSFGLGSDFSLSCDDGAKCVGIPRERVLQRTGQSLALINTMGFCNNNEILASFSRRVFLDIDPGFGQMWRELGLHDPFTGHSDFVTLGQNIGRSDCAIPDCGLKWIKMPQPVVLDYWPAAAGRGEAFTSIGAWRGSNAPVEYKGRRYGLRAHGFREFMELPKLCPETCFEMAFDIHPAETRDLAMLEANRWALAAPKEVAGTPDSYRKYIARSRAEFMVPKQMYVASNSGLLSDRSVYYLASGRPVLAQDTGLTNLYPTGRGLLTFKTLDEAVDGVLRINADYDRHAAAAREIAREYFDSDKVLRRLLTELGIG